MSLREEFDSAVQEMGQLAEVWRGGVKLGTGLALLEPAPRWETQFLPTELGVRREEKWVCYGQAGMPLEPASGETLVKAGGRCFRVVSVQERLAQGQRAFWVAYLTRREEDEV